MKKNKNSRNWERERERVCVYVYVCVWTCTCVSDGMHMCKKNELEEKRKGSIIEIQLIQIECIFEVKEDIKKKMNRVNCKRERACVHGRVYSIGHVFLQNALLEIKRIYLKFWEIETKIISSLIVSYRYSQLLFFSYSHIVHYEAANYHELWILNHLNIFPFFSNIYPYTIKTTPFY